MVDHNLIKSLNVSDVEMEQQMSAALGQDFDDAAMSELVKDTEEHTPGNVLTGHVVKVIGNDVIVEVGLKSEGSVDLSEFDDPESIQPGEPVEVLLEEIESESGLVVLSKRKADRIRGWERILKENKEGDTVSGRVMRKIKGGLLVDIGVPAFLPASQVDIRRPHDIGEYIQYMLGAPLKVLTLNAQCVWDTDLGMALSWQYNAETTGKLIMTGIESEFGVSPNDLSNIRTVIPPPPSVSPYNGPSTSMQASSGGEERIYSLHGVKDIWFLPNRGYWVTVGYGASTENTEGGGTMAIGSSIALQINP